MNGSAEPALVRAAKARANAAAWCCLNPRIFPFLVQTHPPVDLKGPLPYRSGNLGFDTKPPICWYMGHISRCPSSVGWPDVLGCSGRWLGQPRKPRSGIPVRDWRSWLIFFF